MTDRSLIQWLHSTFGSKVGVRPFRKERIVLTLVLPASLPCVYTDVCVTFIHQRAFTYFQPVSNKSLVATLSVMTLVIGEFLLVVSEYALLFSGISPLI